MISFLCKLLYYYFGRHLPNSYAPIKLFGQKIRYRLIKGFCIYVGKNVNIERNVSISSKLSIGDYSGLGENTHAVGKITIGNNVMIAPEVVFITQNHEFNKLDIPMNLQGNKEEKEIIVEDDVWIGRRVIILPGVRIGKGAIIGAGVVVSSNVTPLSILVTGKPTVLRYRK